MSAFIIANGNSDFICEVVVLLKGITIDFHLTVEDEQPTRMNDNRANKKKVAETLIVI